MKHYQLYIFDWDGTLMDSIPRIVSSIQAAAKANSLPMPSDEQAKSIIGLSLEKGIKQLFPEGNSEQVEGIVEQYKFHYREKNETPSPVFPNVEKMLIGLTRNDKSLAVATGKARVGLERVWNTDDLKRYFHSSICADEAHSKPHPQMLETLLAKFELEPSQALMIGDSQFDLAMAKAAGIDSIGVTMGAEKSGQLAAHSPKAIVHSIDELAELIV